MFKRCLARFGSTNRYTDGSGRELDSAIIPRELFAQPISNRAYPRQAEAWQSTLAGVATPHKGTVVISGAGVVGLTTALLFARSGWHTTVVERRSDPETNQPQQQCKKNHLPLPLPQQQQYTLGTAVSATNTSTNPDSSHSDDVRMDGHVPPPPPSQRTDHGTRDPAHGRHVIDLRCFGTYALLTRRGMDALAVAGLTLAQVRRCGVVVDGVLDHPSGFHGILSRHLTEHHAFATRVLAVDLTALRRLLKDQLENVFAAQRQNQPAQNRWHGSSSYGLICYGHTIAAVSPATREVCVEAWRGSRAEMVWRARRGALARALYDNPGQEAPAETAWTKPSMARVPDDTLVRAVATAKSVWRGVYRVMQRFAGRLTHRGETAPPPHADRMQQARTWAVVAAMQTSAPHATRRHTSLTIGTQHWQQRYADSACRYDLLIGADGVNSDLRDLIDVEGFAADVDWGVRWFVLSTCRLSCAHVHRWLYPRQTAPKPPAHSSASAGCFHVCSACAVSVVMAFPCVRADAAEGQMDGLDETAQCRVGRTGVEFATRCGTDHATRDTMDHGKRSIDAASRDDGGDSVEAAEDASRRWFAVMAHMPMAEMTGMSNEAFMQHYMADILRADPDARLHSSHDSYAHEHDTAGERAAAAAAGHDRGGDCNGSASSPSCAEHACMRGSDSSVLDDADRDEDAFDVFGSLPTPAPTVFCENMYNTVGLPSAVVLGDAAGHCHPWWMQGLSASLEDGMYLLSQMQALSRHRYDALEQYSRERGVCSDARREMTERCLYYQTRKHVHPLIRVRNWYVRQMHRWVPAGINAVYEGSANRCYARSLEEMLNGRGYTSYRYAEQQQARQQRFYTFGRLYT